jgi:hypothetical protein
VPPLTGDDGPPLLPPDVILLDGDLFNIFKPNAFFTLLVGDITTLLDLDSF